MMKLSLLTLCLALSLVSCAGAEKKADAPPAEAQTQAHAQAGSHPKDAHHPPGAHDGPLVHRFTDPQRYAERWESPERAAWQKPDHVVALMGVEPGMSVADIGAGTGYFLPWLQGAVGPEGRVYAVDIEPEMVAFIDARIEAEGWASVQTVLATTSGPGLDEHSVDRILIVDTWHHIPERGAYAGLLAGALKPGGAVFIVDFTLETDKGPGKHHRLSPEAVVAELEAGGLTAEIIDEDLPDQYVVVGRVLY